ncbi:uncharacterized protein LOC119094265 [Pollicipes pollicipes]|uniref:uncharacterized protein LOC119092158 n=1 Tax=Pollicipes pollicipes TaxID=41117 RepID=UPI0018850EFD|nr:uncharacterized protein LOC119092158 [Pollicipes pollicipes]XP_037073238.1 uncharacterized protein LOC119094265 [Pollicipes pollicipes]
MVITMARSQGRRLEYCVLLEEDRSSQDGRRFKPPSVCGLEARQKRSPANLTRCGSSRELRRGKRVEVMFSDLPPGQRYIVRAMVRPEGGRFLPYKLRQVKVPACRDQSQLSNELTETNALRPGPVPEQLYGDTAASADEQAEEADNRLTDQP